MFPEHVNPNHASGTAVEKCHELRTNQPARASDEDLHGVVFPPSPVMISSWTWMQYGTKKSFCTVIDLLPYLDGNLRLTRLNTIDRLHEVTFRHDPSEA